MSAQRGTEGWFGPCPESYHFVSFRICGQRPAETPDHLWFSLPHPLRWGVPAASLLRSSTTEKSPDPRGARAAAKQPLQRRRDVAGVALPDDPRARTNRDHAAPAAERCVPGSHRPAELSRVDHAPPVLAACGSRCPAAVARAARSLAFPNDRASGGPDAADPGYRLDGLGGLWPPGAGAGRVQPDQARTPIVPSTALLRWSDEGLLAWGATAGGCPYRQRDPRAAHSVLRQDSRRRPVGNCPRRQRLLRSRSRRVAGGSPRRLRDPSPG